MRSRKKVTKAEEEALLDEVHSICPLCGITLFNKKNGKTIQLWEIAHIYPHSPTQAQLEVLGDVPKVENVESVENLIPLCRACHKTYDIDTTQDEYLKLYKMKRELSHRQRLKSVLAGVNIEKDIVNVIEKMSEMDGAQHIDLRLSPVRVKNKIVNNRLLLNKILANVTQYHAMIRACFQEMDAKKTNTSCIIGSSISIAYLKTTQEELGVDQEFIFDSLVEWLCSKTRENRSACEIIISYFVQNCEVFDAITE